MIGIKRKIHPSVYKTSLVPLFLFLAGLAFGAAAGKVMESDIGSQLAAQLVDITISTDRSVLAMELYHHSFMILLRLYFFGLCLPGMLFCGGYIFFRGFSTGFVLSFCAIYQPWLSLMQCLAHLVVPQLFLLVPFWAAAMVSWRYSCGFIGSSGRELWGQLGRYHGVWLVIFLLLLPWSMAEATLIIRLIGA